MSVVTSQSTAGGTYVSILTAGRYGPQLELVLGQRRAYGVGVIGVAATPYTVSVDGDGVAESALVVGY